MNPDKETVSYKLYWKQSYPEWQEASEKILEDLVECSGLIEANEVIDRIKKL